MVDPAPSAPRRWTSILLAVSLALNLLVVGIVVGFVFDSHGPERWRDRPAAGQFGRNPLIAALDEEERRRMLEDMRQRAEPLRENREALRQRFETMLTLLRAEPFEPDALRAALAEQRRAASDRQALGEELLIARLAAMTPNARAAYAERLDRAFARRGDGRR
ncbi:periplasmic heavy metal sensor [Roseitranquillus sediminis]|uniref:periplasmic heavy metal sensor n=1 Tax=Roseitranquillus sediminis TaxID=2809051 RepID=UPI001D0C7902|nr:periplasmic heavy metal sensor [Roseitranquillus sediminis]MBM9596067.1 periplasmic heavy metal sensor [Roseitranquillus sediminis]